LETHTSNQHSSAFGADIPQGNQKSNGEDHHHQTRCTRCWRSNHTFKECRAKYCFQCKTNLTDYKVCPNAMNHTDITTRFCPPYLFKKINKTSDNDKYFSLFVDRRISYCHAYTSKTKDGVITALQRVNDFCKEHGCTMHIFRGDVENFSAKYAVSQQYLLPYSHYQNLVERHAQTVVKTISTIMHDQVLLDGSFWNYALFHVIQTKKATPNTKTDGRTPATMILKGPQVDFSRRFLFPFGTPVAIRVNQSTWKFDVRTELGIYLGESESSINGGLIYYPSKKAILP